MGNNFLNCEKHKIQLTKKGFVALQIMPRTVRKKIFQYEYYHYLDHPCDLSKTLDTRSACPSIELSSLNMMQSVKQKGVYDKNMALIRGRAEWGDKVKVKCFFPLLPCGPEAFNFPLNTCFTALIQIVDLGHWLCHEGN